MAHADFVHLRVHTAYSLSEGAITIEALTDLCRDKKMPAVAMTDTNNLFGALEFATACARAGVQPIIGCQLSIARETGKDGPQGLNGALNGGSAQEVYSDPLVLLVQNEAGYHNLLKLIRHAYLENAEATDPQVPLSALTEYADGLIALSGGPEGPVGRQLLDGQMDAARTLMEQLAGIFPDRLYVELMRHGLQTEKDTEPHFLDLAYEMGLPLVATNEAFFSDATMHEAHDALICIAEGTYISSSDRRRLTPDHGFKSANEMRALFADLPEAVDNTLVVARRTAFMVEPRDPILPPYDCGEGRSEEEELRAQAMTGLKNRLETQVYMTEMSADEKKHAADPYLKRLDYELQIIVDMGYPGYFLIVADFIR